MFIQKGKAHKLGDNINTDYIISGRYKFRIQDPRELARHVFEDLEPGFYARIKKGDFIVGGNNFGCGSSREQAPLALKYAHVSAVIARGFARIFYRNAFNIGLALIECDTSSIAEGDLLELNIKEETLRNLTRKKDIGIKPLSPVMRKLLEDGGLIKHFKKHGGLNL